jgi:membrane protease YdiL (CAAX protease family)
MVDLLKSLIWVGLLEKARHRDGYTQQLACLYCFSLSIVYVAALYLFVPKRVRKLNRDHARHIKFRVFASLLVSTAAVVSYPLLFCAKADENSEATFSVTDVMLAVDLRHSLGPLVHTIVLYLGPIVEWLLYVSDEREAAIARGQARGVIKPPASFWKVLFRLTFRPTLLTFINPISPEERWKSIRNLIVAPWTEELVFRGCMMSALIGSGMSPIKSVLVSPLFFGVAHAHHAWMRVSNGERLRPVLFATAFQLAYTSLFGAYAAFAFYRSGSVMAVTLSHVYCNLMGLPDFNFVQPHHPMYRYRSILLASFVVGVFGFKWGFSTDLFLPHPPVLATAVHGGRL